MGTTSVRTTEVSVDRGSAVHDGMLANPRRVRL